MKVGYHWELGEEKSRPSGQSDSYRVGLPFLRYLYPRKGCPHTDKFGKR